MSRLHSVLVLSVRPVAAAVAITMLIAAVTFVSAMPVLDRDMAERSQTAAERMFADAPDGVDPIVTGPTSAEFKARQRAAGCAEAKWPDVPALCYPG